MIGRKLFAAVLIAMLGNEFAARAGEVSPKSAAVADASNAVTTAEVPLTNKAVLVISRLRGVDPSQVKLRSGRHAAGPFEIELGNAADGQREAEELSRELGPAATVIFERVSADGVTRTNWSFRGGSGRKVTAPAGPSGLGPNGTRLYVWPQTSVRVAPPSGVRVRTREND